MDISKIPEGIYCYDQNGVCPFWSRNPDEPQQDNGHCSLMQLGDWESETILHLWDQVKECSLNMGDDDG